MYLNFGKIYDLNFKVNVAYYPIVGSSSILRHALRDEREHTKEAHGETLDGYFTVSVS